MREPLQQANHLARIDDIGFGPFRLLRKGEALYRDNRPIRLGSRARQILSLLVSRAGEVVLKRDIIETVWPDTIVLEANLAVHISALRQALGESRDGPRYIVNIPGRGYRFVGHVFAIEAPNEENGGERPVPNNLPIRRSTPIGREKPVEDLHRQLNASTIVTITGPAGVGKTTLALLLAEEKLDRYPDGVWLIDLALVAGRDEACAAIASILRVELDAGDPGAALARAIGDRRLLLIADNCEHLVEPMASIITGIANFCTRTDVLCTSRETLGIPGEIVHRLSPLEYPRTTRPIGAAEALAFPAVRLLVERATSSMSDFSLTDRDASAAVEICQRLDGMPLAIELTAPLVSTFGITGIATRLGDHLRLLGIGRRNATPRHRSIEAALDWSYQLLDPVEQCVLRRLAIFAGGFTMEAAEEILPGPGELIEVGATLASLSLKSLLITDITGHDLRFRFLETTRAFALTKLVEANEANSLAERHARYFQAFLRRLRRNIPSVKVEDHLVELDNMRAALRFALGPNGNADLALSLAAGALPLWFGLSLMAECHARVEEVSARLSPEQWHTSEAWDLTVATRAAEMFTRGTRPEEYAAWDKPSDELRKPDYSSPTILNILTVWTWNIRKPDYREMMTLARRHEEYALAGSAADRIMSDWVMGLSTHHVGDFKAARAHLARFMATETSDNRRLFVSHTGFDRTPGAQAMLGATLCVQGDIQEGIVHAIAAEKEGRTTGKAMALCEALMWGCAATEIAEADIALIAERLDLLIREASNHELLSHRGVGMALKGIGLSRATSFSAAEDFLTEGLETINQSQYGPFKPWIVGELAHVVGRQGRPVEGLAMIRSFRETDTNGDSWCTPELLRNEGRLFALSGDRQQASASFDAATVLAVCQGASMWRKRADRDRELFCARLS